ncbi:hypothetical protein Nepgr_029884 [Nepenthes gracilis]|uniref:Uncharacterized protein n=1 Tax=Nepenthes gracilis TaxID=150966 RepID=A0AAD3TFU8_NEPGR|nr:hypothetical protein Nepgr_029884 [Nepenthes gracilis]
MGISASKRVSRRFRDSEEFNSACDSVFEECLTLTQHAFPGIFPYQLSEACYGLHFSLSSSDPLVKKWLPSPPSLAQVDRAYRLFSLRRARCNDYHSPPSNPQPQPPTLGSDEFKAFAVELFTDSVVSNAGKEMIVRIPIGVAGIAGVGMATRAGKNLIGPAIGVYALGVATSIYVSLFA